MRRKIEISDEDRFRINNEFKEGVSTLALAKKCRYTRNCIEKFLPSVLGNEEYKKITKEHKRNAIIHLNNQRKIELSSTERMNMVFDFSQFDASLRILTKKYCYCDITIKKFLIEELGEIGYKKYADIHRSTHRPVMKKEAHPLWRGGISFEPYCILFNTEFKERVREYWDRRCVLCNKSEKENGRKLCVHHVTYNKDVCGDNTKPLFVLLCGSCHPKTNSNIDYWTNYFTNLIYKQDKNGKCFYTKEEMKKIIK